MITKLLEVKGVIEKEIGERIDTKNRKRPLTYARAVYSMIGRDMGIPYAHIGEVIDRDHATIIHSVKKVFPFAMQDDNYKRIYETLKALMVPKDKIKKRKMGRPKKNILKEFNAFRDMNDRMNLLTQENESLRRRLKNLERDNAGITDLTKGLSEDELEQLYYKMSLFVKAIKSGSFS